MCGTAMFVNELGHLTTPHSAFYGPWRFLMAALGVIYCKNNDLHMQAYASSHLHPAFWLHNHLPWTRPLTLNTTTNPEHDHLPWTRTTLTLTLTCVDFCVFTCYTEQLPKSFIVMIRLAPGDCFILYLFWQHHRRYPVLPISNINTDVIISFTSESFLCYYVHMLSHALVHMLTMLCLIYVIWYRHSGDIYHMRWAARVGTHHTRKLIYACDRLGLLLSLVIVFFISYVIVYLFTLLSFILFSSLFYVQAKHAGNNFKSGLV